VDTTGSSFARLPGRPAPSTRPLSPPGLQRTLAKARAVPRCPQHGCNRPASRRLACSACSRFGRFPHRHRSAGYAAWFNHDSPKRWRRGRPLVQVRFDESLSLCAASFPCGLRPQGPSRAELERVRYTPITAGFAPVAELSLQFANRRGLASDSTPDGDCQGILLDVAEPWELYVLALLRRAA